MKRQTIDQLLDAKMPPEESYDAFAARAGVTSRTVRNLRAGRRRRPHRRVVARIAAALGVEADTVLRAVVASHEARQGCMA